MTDAFKVSGGSGPATARWALLVGLSVALAATMEAVRVPAGLFLGPMIAAIVMAMGGTDIRLPRAPYAVAQAVVGLVIARNIPLSLLAKTATDWPIFLGGVTLVIAASYGLGWLLARRQVVAGTTAMWGFSPGAALAMIVMAEEFGADVQLVAFIQSLRMLCVALAATGVAGVWGMAHQHPATIWFGPIAGAALAATLALGVVGVWLAKRLRVPSGALLVPMVLGILVQRFVPLELPPLLTAAAYAAIGWGVGLRFTRPILRHAFAALPWILAAIVALLAVCGVISVGLAKLAHIDALSAYLAASPGGLDTVAIIAASCKVDLPFVMSMQAARFMLVLAVGPSLARFLAAHTGSGRRQNPAKR